MKNEDKLRLRTSTPGCHDQVYLDNAGAALLSTQVVTTLKSAIEQEMMEGGYCFQARQQETFNRLRQNLASLIGANTQDIAIVDSASRAWLCALQAMHFKPGDEIITSQVEYGANVASFCWLERFRGVNIRVLPFDQEQGVLLDKIPSLCSDKTRLLALTYCPSNNGYMLDAEKASHYARSNNFLYLLDACQALGQLPVDVAQLGCDFLTATGRKYLRAPRATGFLYVSATAREKIKPILNDHSHGMWSDEAQTSALSSFNSDVSAQQLESWEKSSVNLLGLAQAIQEVSELGIKTIEAEIQSLPAYVRDSLISHPRISVLDFGERLSGIVSFTVKSRSLTRLKAELRARKIEIGESHFSAAPWLPASYSETGVFRVSPHYYNTRDEIDQFISSTFDILSASEV